MTDKPDNEDTDPSTGFPDVWEAELCQLNIASGPTAPESRTSSTDSPKLSRLKQLVDGLDRPIAALCLSGGGIRSASFALGMLQGLAQFRLLQKFHYLSTVSGGGYIGGWLSACRLATNDDEVFAALNELQRSGSEAGEIAGIRADSNYLTPKLGLLSADTWTVIALYVRNLFLNWCMFLPFFLGVLFFPRLCQSLLSMASPPDTGPRTSLILVLVGVALVLLTAALTVNVYGRYAGCKEFLTKRQFLMFVLAPIVVAGASLTVAAKANPPIDIGGSLVRYAVLIGMGVYALSWLVARLALLVRQTAMQFYDLVAWVAAGAMVGLIVGLETSVDTTTIRADLLTVIGLSGLVIALFAGEIVYIGLSSYLEHAEDNREWLARSSGWLASTAIAWLIVSSLVLYGPRLVTYLWGSWARIPTLTAGGISGAVTLIIGWGDKTSAIKAKLDAAHVTMLQIASAASVVFVIFLGLALSFVDQRLAVLLCDQSWLWQNVSPQLKCPAVCDAGAMLVLIGFSAAVSFAVNINRFSLHALYRNRLIRAFLGSARARAKKPRQPDAFTGFDFADNVHMSKLVGVSEPARLFHVVNMALNVVSSSNPAWQERKAESFTATPLATGNAQVGYRNTEQYAHPTLGLSLGTAMAISGAAVSPNMGYNSSPLIGLLLMLFNIRLGWWLGNPAKHQYRQQGPSFSLTPALQELAGATTDASSWVNLSDGGHFENLGLYEMVRRRCRFIVVSDAGCDPQCTFDDLGNAVRKCFIDFGVSINFEDLGIKARLTPPGSSARVAVGSIIYPQSSKPGILIYVKPTYCQTSEPPHVRSYATAHSAFPHETTANQWFSESQLEAYRALGAHVIEHICTGGVGVTPGEAPPSMTMDDLYVKARASLGVKPAPCRRWKDLKRFFGL